MAKARGCEIGRFFWVGLVVVSCGGKLDPDATGISVNGSLGGTTVTRATDNQGGHPWVESTKMAPSSGGTSNAFSASSTNNVASSGVGGGTSVFGGTAVGIGTSGGQPIGVAFGGAAGAATTTPASNSILSLKFARSGPVMFTLVSPGTLLELSIDYTQLGNYSVFGKAVESWPPECRCQTSDPSPCFTTITVGPRLLTDAEAQEFERLAAALPMYHCIVDPNLACDPYFVAWFHLEGNSYDDQCCGTQADPSYDSAFRALVQFVDGLAASGR